MSSDGVPGRLRDRLSPGGHGPPDLAARHLLHLPARVLLDPMVEAALRVAVTQAGPAARLVGDVVLEVAAGRAPAAAGPGTRGVPDLGQVPQHHSGVVTSCFVAVITVASGDRPDLD